MKKYLFIGALGVLVLSLLLVWLLPESETPDQPEEPTVTLPISGSNNQTTTGTEPGVGGKATLTVGSQISQGGVVTRDFINNGVTAHDVQNQGQYYLAGAPGYCLSDGSCPSGAPSDGYNIVYLSRDKSFIIALLREPLGEARKKAEAFLLDTLGIGETEACTLKYYISTDTYTNSLYAGKNLLFSFCPGATKLPR